MKGDKNGETKTRQDRELEGPERRPEGARLTEGELAGAPELDTDADDAILLATVAPALIDDALAGAAVAVDEDEFPLPDEAEDEAPEADEEEEGDPADLVLGGDEALFEQDDPLAEAYDLEEGTPLAKSAEIATAAASQAWRSKIRSAKEFFNDEILYRFDGLEEEDRRELPGRYRIELKGYQGGVWTVEVGESLQVVNRREEAEIVLAMQQRDFLNLVNGQLNPQLAIFAQKMKIAGDVRQAVRFQALLVPHGD